MEHSDWHIFLGVARQGSTLAASRVLGVSQSTVSRRIDALEEALNVKLFERRPSGYTLTEAGTQLVPRAEAIEAAIAEALSVVRQYRRGTIGQVRVTTSVAIGQTIMVRAIRDFRLAYPDIAVEQISSEAALDLMAGEADIALRTGETPGDAGLVARKVLMDRWSVYCSRDYAARHGTPRTGDELKLHPVIAMSKGFRDNALVCWMDNVVPESSIVMRHGEIPGLLAGLRDGLGVGMMSDTVADATGLVHCFNPPVGHEVPLWLVTTEHLRKEPRIRVFVDFLAGYMAQGRYRRPADDAPAKG